MNPFEKTSTENLHHAFLVVGERKAARESVAGFLHKNFEVVSNSGNPDTQNIVCDTLTVDHARKIATDAGRRSFGGGRKFFLIETNIITEEAQNSLLKIFEEPAPDTHFFVMMPQDILLPTLRSRMQTIFMSGTEKKSENILKKSLAERLVLVKEITEGISDEEKTKQDAVALLNGIEDELYRNGTQKEADNLELCQKTRGYLYDRGAPVKMILENLMISLG